MSYKKIVLILALVIILFLGILFFVLFFYPKNQPPVDLNTTNTDKTQVGIEQINLLLYNIKAYELHNLPLSKNTPKIEISIENEAFNSEIINGKIKTQKGAINNKDIQIKTSKSEFLKILNSKDIKKELQNSAETGNLEIEMRAGKLELASKGYLNIYKEVTGKSLIGNIIKSLN